MLQQHGVLCEAKWWRRGVIRIKLMQLVYEYVRIITISLTKWCHNNKHFAELATHQGEHNYDTKKLRHLNVLHYYNTILRVFLVSVTVNHFQMKFDWLILWQCYVTDLAHKFFVVWYSIYFIRSKKFFTVLQYCCITTICHKPTVWHNSRQCDRQITP